MQEGEEMTGAEYRRRRRAGPLQPRHQREDFGDIFCAESYRGPWAGHAGRKAPPGTGCCENRVVSRQNIAPGRERCKAERESLHAFFRPVPLPEPSCPDRRQTLHHHKDRITDLRFFKRYDFLMSSSLDGRIVIWRDRPLRTFMGHSMGIAGAGLSFDETTLVSASYDGWVKRWDIESGRCRERVRSAEPIVACDVRDGHAVVGGSCGTVSLVSVHGGGVVYSAAESRVRVRAVAQCGRFVAVTRADGSVEFREACSGGVVAAVKGSYRSIVFEEKRKAFIADSEGEVHVFGDFAVRERWGIEDQTTGLRLQPGGGIVYGNSRGEVVFAAREDRLRLSESEILCFDVSARNCRSIAVGHADGRIDIHD